ncbi:MAG: CoB--CoM heterodisulfide reductase iron-sulfur subunit A family protein [Bryobacteraceae bacterium]|nr:CoB--CoM heterodisulfide reductase iron-sulfur subunit A family protein [Bryobacteraceae bacterium]
MAEIKQEYDGLVLGAGIAGMQAALDLAGQGFDVLLVERAPSIGGVMVGLNKVFPTLDCSSCICTPRMAEVAHHERITLLTYTELKHLERTARGFSVTLVKKPRYVVEEDCIGCAKCELACNVVVPHEFDYGLGAHAAVYIPHGNAIPQVAVLDPQYCMFDGACARACPTDCIDFTQQPEEINVQAGAVILATGLKLVPLDVKKEYGGGKYVNVMNPLAMERLQSPNGPYGHVMRPSDGKIPRSIAYVQCAGSRDKSIGVPYCSRICCMYALKQGIMIRQHLPETEVTIYHMDIRAFGKGYEQFYRRAVGEGIRVVKAKVARITEEPNKDLKLRVELIDEGGRVAEIRHDLVVLSQGVIPGWKPDGAAPVRIDEDGFFLIPEMAARPANSSHEGVFVAGVATGPKDIPDAIVEAGAAAMEAAMYLGRSQARAGGVQ